MGKEGGVDCIPIVIGKVSDELWVFVCDNGGVLCWLDCKFLLLNELSKACGEGR